MNSIDQYISDLLYDHDCVIVPSLGGFLASGMHAGIHHLQHTISPPFRKIAFNVYLRQHDGLLANHLVEFEHITYQDALKRIDEFVTGCFAKLEQGEKVTVQRVGILAYDKERNLQFEPFRQINYQKNVFGMSPVRLIPVDREHIQVTKAKPRGEFSSLRPSEKNKVRVPLTRRTARNTYLGIIAVTGAVVWFSINLYLVNSDHFMRGSLNPFDKEVPASIKNDDGNQKIAPVAEPNHTAATSIETVYVSTAVPETTASIEKPKTPDTNLQSPENAVVSPIPPKIGFDADVYYVIAGVFKIPGNAQAFVKSLRDKGFQGAGIIQSGKLNYVCFDDFSGRKEARLLLDSLSKEQYSAWILHN